MRSSLFCDVTPRIGTYSVKGTNEDPITQRRKPQFTHFWSVSKLTIHISRHDRILLSEAKKRFKWAKGNEKLNSHSNLTACEKTTSNQSKTRSIFYLTNITCHSHRAGWRSLEWASQFDNRTDRKLLLLLLLLLLTAIRLSPGGSSPTLVQTK